jgi:NACHT domain
VRGGKRPGGGRRVAAARHPPRRDAVIALTLLLLPGVVSLVLVRRHHHLDVAAVGIVVALSVGLPPIWLAWAAGRGPGRSGGVSLAEVADRLATAVGAQWEAEAAIRRLNDPYPLAVSWAAADPALTDPWDGLVKLATSGAGWPPHPPAGTWAAGPSELAGEGGELAEVLARVPTGRLVVLGEPGAGKTMLMVRLVLDLLSRRTEGARVPVLASVASWNPAEQDLHQWLGDQLLIDHPALGNPPPTGSAEPNQARALVAAGLILPILDGLDEMPAEGRRSAVSRINDALRPGEQMVVTCRTTEYRNAVRPREGGEVTLRAAVVQLRPLDASAVRDYLCDDAAGPVMRARWAPVLGLLGTEAPAAQVLRTPLMVGLARAIYNPRPGELVGALRDPVELCGPALADRAAVEAFLFDAFIPAAYRHDPAGRWKAQDAERWLAFLASQLESTILKPDLAWWELPVTVSAAGPVAALVLGLVAGVAGSMLAGPGLGVVAGVGAAVVAGLAAIGINSIIWSSGDGSDYDPDPDPDPYSYSYSLPGFPAIDIAGTVMRVVIGILVTVGGVSVSAAIIAGVAVGALTGALSGTLAGAVTFVGVLTGMWFAADPYLASEESPTSPKIFININRRSTIRVGLTIGIATGAIAGFLAGIPAGVLTGVVAGVGANYTALWPPYVIARIWLALRHRLPWRLMGFLADAHRRGVLRQAGAVYQFRHIELQERLARESPRIGFPP